jgi:hypothetical protein
MISARVFSLLIALLTGILGSSAVVMAEPIKLKNAEGKEILAEVIALRDDKVDISVAGKRMSYPMSQLTEESRAEVKKALEQVAKKALQAKLAKMKLPDGQVIVPGQMMNFTLPVPEDQTKLAKEETFREVLVAVAFPKNFDPSQPCPVFFVDDTMPGQNAKVARNYQAVGNEMGYVVIGAHAVGSAKGNNLSTWYIRGLSARIAIDALSDNWPAIVDSQWYYGGCSGGGKNCCYLSIFLYETYDHHASGYFASATNEMKLLDAMETYKSDKKAFKKSLVYVSAGKQDKVATVAMSQQVADAFKSAGVAEVRMEIHDNGHTVHHPHFRQALEWFSENAASTK